MSGAEGVAPALRPAEAPTIYFIGVTTGQSSILRIFPAWAAELGLGRARIVGVDLPVGAPAAAYRRVAGFIKADPLSRGALVTTHKIDLFAACRDLFDAVDPVAELMREASCLSKAGGRFSASAKDAVSAGLALEALTPPGHFARTGGALFSIGAGGAATAITWNLMRPARGEDRPRRVVVSDISEARLEAIRRVHAQAAPDLPAEYRRVTSPAENDQLLAALPAGSLVVNATGLGKDSPGSPLTDAARFPADGVAWELNYRGDLVFLRQARAAAERAPLRVADGWTYFLHGWTRVIAEVFAVDIPVSGPVFERLSELAGGPPAAQ